MSNIQGLKDGTNPIEAVFFTAHRDPLFQTTLLNVTTPATHAIPTTVHNYGPRGAGRLGIVVGADAIVPAFNLTFVIKDIDGLIIGSNVTQTIPETPGGTTVLTPLNLTQQQILRGQTISFTGDVVLAALGTKLVVKLAEQSPEQEVSVSGDGIATEVTLAAMNTVQGALTDAPLAGDAAEDGTARSGIALWKRAVNQLIDIKAYCNSLVAYFLAWLQKQNLSGADMYNAVGTRSGDTTFTFTPPAPVASMTVTPIDIRAIFCRSTVAGSIGLWYEVPMSQMSVSGAPAPFTVTVTGATFPATCEIKVFFRGAVRAFDTSADADKVAVNNPDSQKYTGPAAIGAQQTFTNAYADWGGEISCLGYKNIGLYIDKTIGTSSAIKIQILAKHTGAAADEYVLETDIALGDATGYIFLPRSTLMNTVGYIQLQIKAAAGGTGTVNAGSRYILSA